MQNKLRKQRRQKQRVQKQTEEEEEAEAKRATQKEQEAEDAKRKDHVARAKEAERRTKDEAMKDKKRKLLQDPTHNARQWLKGVNGYITQNQTAQGQLQQEGQSMPKAQSRLYATAFKENILKLKELRTEIENMLDRQAGAEELNKCLSQGTQRIHKAKSDVKAFSLVHRSFNRDKSNKPEGGTASGKDDQTKEKSQEKTEAEAKKQKKEQEAKSKEKKEAEAKKQNKEQEAEAERATKAEEEAEAERAKKQDEAAEAKRAKDDKMKANRDKSSSTKGNKDNGTEDSVTAETEPTAMPRFKKGVCGRTPAAAKSKASPKDPKTGSKKRTSGTEGQAGKSKNICLEGTLLD